jgi:hypothetical protein
MLERYVRVINHLLDVQPYDHSKKLMSQTKEVLAIKEALSELGLRDLPEFIELLTAVK